MPYNELNEEERRVILNKGTERSFTGKYWNHKEDGMYTCRQCNADLFPSSTKFDSGTGWPSFDDAVEGAVTEVPDADGRRTEIVCSNCSGHLGHVFKGEGMTPKSIRHCVNSISLNFVPKSQ
jgi:methionine-R-sulfoxide reductase